MVKKGEELELFEENFKRIKTFQFQKKKSAPIPIPKLDLGSGTLKCNILS